jgi:probable F420-dependent oxidoreductase
MRGGRFRLGLGYTSRSDTAAHGAGPAERLAQSVAAIKAIFAAWEGEAPPDFHGRFFTHTLMVPNFHPGPNPFGPPPVFIGALGPIMTRKAAEVADGLLVMTFNSARHFTERTIPALADGFSRAGRDPAGFEVVAHVMVAMGRTDAELGEAIDRDAALIAFYGSTPSYVPVLQVEGFDHIHPALNGLSKTGNFVDMRGLITDSMVETIAAVGTPEQCASEIAARFAAHAGHVCCYFPGYLSRPDSVADVVAAFQDIPGTR